jgi:hypothetical protein
MPRIWDGDWYLFDHDEKLGRTVWARTNGDGSTTFRTDYRVDPTIDANTAMRNMASPGWKGDWHKVASIPLNIFHDQLAEASRQEDDRYLSKWLNDGSNKAWRTKDGTV